MPPARSAKAQVKLRLRSRQSSASIARAAASIIIPGLPAPYVTAKVWLQLLKAQLNGARNVEEQAGQ